MNFRNRKFSFAGAEHPTGDLAYSIGSVSSFIFVSDFSIVSDGLAVNSKTYEASLTQLRYSRSVSGQGKVTLFHSTTTYTIPSSVILSITDDMSWGRSLTIFNYKLSCFVTFAVLGMRFKGHFFFKRILANPYHPKRLQTTALEAVRKTRQQFFEIFDPLLLRHHFY